VLFFGSAQHLSANTQRRTAAAEPVADPVPFFAGAHRLSASTQRRTAAAELVARVLAHHRPQRSAAALSTPGHEPAAGASLGAEDPAPPAAPAAPQTFITEYVDCVETIDVFFESVDECAYNAG
jgi:hypothetical protein